jgi:hypothetical protein
MQNRRNLATLHGGLFPATTCGDAAHGVAIYGQQPSRPLIFTIGRKGKEILHTVLKTSQSRAELAAAN